MIENICYRVGETIVRGHNIDEILKKIPGVKTNRQEKEKIAIIGAYFFAKELGKHPFMKVGRLKKRIKIGSEDAKKLFLLLEENGIVCQWNGNRNRITWKVTGGKDKIFKCIKRNLKEVKNDSKHYGRRDTDANKTNNLKS